MILNLLPKRASGAILKPLGTCDYASACYYYSVQCKYVENIRNNVGETPGGATANSSFQHESHFSQNVPGAVITLYHIQLD